jgi:predicted transcriptional regulator
MPKDVKIVTVQIDTRVYERFMKYIWDKFAPYYERKKSFVINRALDEFLKKEGY